MSSNGASFVLPHHAWGHLAISGDILGCRYHRPEILLNIPQYIRNNKEVPSSKCQKYCPRNPGLEEVTPWVQERGKCQSIKNRELQSDPGASVVTLALSPGSSSYGPQQTATMTPPLQGCCQKVMGRYVRYMAFH